MDPKDGPLTESEITSWMNAAREAAKQEADEHYANLLRAFLDTIPAYLHRTGQNAPSPVRPQCFNSDTTGYQFFLQFPEDHAITAAVFRFRKKKLIWAFSSYVSQMAKSPFQFEIAESKSLPNALLVAREMWLAHQQFLADSGLGNVAASQQTDRIQ